MAQAAPTRTAPLSPDLQYQAEATRTLLERYSEDLAARIGSDLDADTERALAQVERALESDTLDMEDGA
ncbi:MAG: hypothetical protein BRC58_06080 [Cyanobacteria bacterium QS_8_64_29]|nr:MAG: hypothetical protein BRC58_06080 [Cyanobacteria bacterium QS_8_64_29]